MPRWGFALLFCKNAWDAVLQIHKAVGGWAWCVYIMPAHQHITHNLVDQLVLFQAVCPRIPAQQQKGGSETASWLASPSRHYGTACIGCKAQCIVCVEAISAVVHLRVHIRACS